MDTLQRNRSDVQPTPRDLAAEVLDGTADFPTPEDSAWWAEELGLPDGEPPCEPRLPFAEWVRVRASLIRLDGSNAAKWLADEVDQLADLAVLLKAETPDVFRDRRGASESGRSEDLVYAGYTRGYEDGKCETFELFGRG